jgi:hypothetical protein
MSARTVGFFSFITAALAAGVVGLVACDSDETSGPPSANPGTDAGGAVDGSGNVTTDAGTDGSSEASSSTTGPGAGPYTLAYAGTDVGIDMRPVADGKAVFDGAKLTSYESSEDERPSAGTNEVKEVTGSSLFSIGRWAGGTTGGKFYNAGNGGLIDFPANGGFHYAIGIPADPIPSSGAATYTELAKTSATISDGSLAPGTITGTLAANLAGATSKIGFSITLDIPGDASYVVASAGGSADPAQAQTGVAAIKGAFFDNDVTVTSAGTLCAGGCTGGVDGLVLGPAGENIALVIHVYKGSGGAPKSVSGAIVFKK